MILTAVTLLCYATKPENVQCNHCGRAGGGGGREGGTGGGFNFGGLARGGGGGRMGAWRVFSVGKASWSEVQRSVISLD